MPADLKPLLDDLAAESAVVGALLDPLAPADWGRPTPRPAGPSPTRSPTWPTSTT